MQNYYIAELQNSNSYTVATKIQAKSLLGAKRIATSEKVFLGTVLEIGLAVNDDGFILAPISQKINGSWLDC